MGAYASPFPRWARGSAVADAGANLTECFGGFHGVLRARWPNLPMLPCRESAPLFHRKPPDLFPRHFLSAAARLMSAPTVTTRPVMMCFTGTFSGFRSAATHRSTMSRSVIIPQILPFSSHTGSAPTLYRASILAATAARLLGTHADHPGRHNILYLHRFAPPKAAPPAAFYQVVWNNLGDSIRPPGGKRTGDGLFNRRKLQIFLYKFLRFSQPKSDTLQGGRKPEGRREAGNDPLGGEGPQTAGHSQFGSGQPGREPPPQLCGAITAAGGREGRPWLGRGGICLSPDRGKATCKGKKPGISS